MTVITGDTFMFWLRIAQIVSALLLAYAVIVALMQIKRQDSGGFR